ncbi:MAG: nucleoside hydrolase [Chloroflexi bacterium]|nr:nucleoside hydrolase [Chloroflexota bacterium]MCL5273631.1 nucleoside hydrolase [Chloroflexota bacterium]
MTTKLILDTDIGSDIDDAVCLAYLLAQPECELLGITTVTGEPVRRAMMASALCKVAGKPDIPIYPGAETPLSIKQLQPVAKQASALDKWPHETQFPQGQALDFLRDTIHRYPGEITLLTIGPLTNIGMLFQSDPPTARLLKRIVLMCGVFGGKDTGHGLAEWNAKLDPAATDIVYRAPVAEHRSIGLDVTTQVTMDVQTVRMKFQAKLLRPVLDFAEVWFHEADRITFHDPLAATTIFDDTICGFERGTVTVELQDEQSLGRTLWKPANGLDAPHEVALQVQPQRFFEHYFGVVSRV